MTLWQLQCLQGTLPSNQIQSSALHTMYTSCASTSNAAYQFQHRCVHNYTYTMPNSCGCMWQHVCQEV
jgi:hypothetical protein